MDVCEVNEGTVAIRGFGWRSKRRYRRERHLRFSSPLRSSSDPAYAIFLELKLSEDVRSLAEQGWRSVLQIQQESRHLGHPTRLRASLSLLRTTLHFWTGNSRRVATNEKKNRVAGRVGGGTLKTWGRARNGTVEPPKVTSVLWYGNSDIQYSWRVSVSVGGSILRNVTRCLGFSAPMDASNFHSKRRLAPRSDLIVEAS